MIFNACAHIFRELVDSSVVTVFHTVTLLTLQPCKRNLYLSLNEKKTVELICLIVPVQTVKLCVVVT